MFEGLLQKPVKVEKLTAQPKGPRADSNAVLRKIMGARFIESREINGWGQTEAALKLGYGNSTQLSLIERADRLPPIEVVKRASTIYGVSCDYLMGTSDEPERDPKHAEKRAAMRQVSDMLESNAEAIVDAMMDSIASGAPTVMTTKGLVDQSVKMVEAFNRFREINVKKFDELRGGSPVVAAIRDMESLAANAQQLLDRHDHFVIKANDAARKQREQESRMRAQRRAAESTRKISGLSNAQDQYHLSLADRDVVAVRPS
jgi:transcriptional regulator with XRE-family HTH domain